MRITKLPIEGVLLIEPAVFRDHRGFFVETFSAVTLRNSGVPGEFVQDNHSRSGSGVLRGLHYQRTKLQGKLVHVARGRIFDVAVDLRSSSPTFGRWVGAQLDDENLASLWIPEGFAHGFCVLSDVADVIYKCTAPYFADDERGVAWNDPEIAIEWPVSSPSVSHRDARLPMLAKAELPVMAG